MIESASLDVWQMWAILGGLVVAIVFFVWDRFPIEIVSASIVAALMLFFHFFPLEDGRPSIAALLEGFANPALFTILCLLIVGQGIFQTGAMEGPTQFLLSSYDQRPRGTLIAMFAFVFVVSAFINNTPVVVMFVPILVAIARRMEKSPSKLMIPLSYVCILAGMTTLIGSSTNLLVAEQLRTISGVSLDFFTPTVPGLFLAAFGLVYIVFVLPRLLPDRDTMEGELAGSGEGRQYIAQIEVTADHPLAGKRPVAGMFADLPDMTVRMIQRGEHALLPPFDQIELKAGDLVIVAATRQTLSNLLSKRADFMRGMLEASGPGENPTPGDSLMITEAVVAPGSRLIGRTIQQIGFRHATGCIVLGIQRRSRMIRSRMGEIRLEAGDTLLLFGSTSSMRQLRSDRDLLLMEWATTALADPRRANVARAIFAGVVIAAATSLMPIALASFLGAVAMIAGGCLNTRQAARAVDIRIYLLIGSAIALGTALQITGGADLLATGVVTVFSPFGPVVLMSAMFILIALLTNVLSNSATAILFTPIAVGAANQIGADPSLFALTVLFAANTCFATPIGYQTNLLVMGPGHYRFMDYIRAGAPMVVLFWIAFTLYISLLYAFDLV
ncbi:SLC13 family permease [Maricaulis virginensis]|uniref:Membrane protein n=1 Tax=Maricaulis virginensis TaxID=144022 RepID=A0A9W6IM99_9PROT|nr:SLC13 family permease [Maricaulis virginensis]GLK52147.1 membrane protein [Maricaulis virginensis]